MAERRHNNLVNAVIALVTPLPSILFYLCFLRNANSNSNSPIWSWCYHHPFLLANLLFFFNVDILFWIIGLLQSNHWMIDPYWTVIPVMLAHYYSTHPLLAQSNASRSTILLLLTWIWSVRLSHSYFRREKWQWGAREDWRFADMANQYGNNWWWISFFAVYLSQQVFLMGICLPFYVVHSVDKELTFWDLVAVLVCLTGVAVAYFADTQLHHFVTANARRKELGEPLVPNLDAGFWYYSRHPNYFGEQLWWWGLGIFAWNLGCAWACVGAFINSCVLGYVTLLVEERMLKQEYRAQAYMDYQQTTSVWVPWFKKSSVSKTKQI